MVNWGSVRQWSCSYWKKWILFLLLISVFLRQLALKMKRMFSPFEVLQSCMMFLWWNAIKQQHMVMERSAACPTSALKTSILLLTMGEKNERHTKRNNHLLESRHTSTAISLLWQGHCIQSISFQSNIYDMTVRYILACLSLKAHESYPALFFFFIKRKGKQTILWLQEHLGLLLPEDQNQPIFTSTQ